MEILREKIRKAKKLHHCSYCGGVIPIGEEYGASTIKAFDQVYTWKSHNRCDKIVGVLDMMDECDDGITQDDFQEIITQEYIQLQTDKENYPFPEFQELLNFVCSHHGVYKNPELLK
jgi:hypothetical protein